MTLKFECACGKFGGEIDSKGLRGFRAVCLCNDCQAYAHFLKTESQTLDAFGGTDVFPLHPASLKFTSGPENLKALRLSATGMLRWYADCCKTPIANIPAKPSFPYVGFVHNSLETKNSHDILAREFGPILEFIGGRSSPRPLPSGAQQSVSAAFIIRALKLIVLCFLRRANKPSPFFTSDGTPIVKPYILSADERQALNSH